MHTSRYALAVLGIVVAGISLYGCGGGAGHGEKVALQSVDYAAPPVGKARELKQCLRRAGVALQSKPRKGWRFRIRGILPADEIGFAQLPEGGVMYLWLTVSSAEARRVAALANSHIGREAGTRENEAITHGSGITALAVSPMPRNKGDVQAVYDCLNRT